MIKICPDFTTYEEVEPILMGQGKYRRIITNACFKEKCAAYKDGMCMKYKSVIDKEEYDRSTKKIR